MMTTEGNKARRITSSERERNNRRQKKFERQKLIEKFDIQLECMRKDKEDAMY